MEVSDSKIFDHLYGFQRSERFPYKTPHVETHLHNLDQRIKQNKLWTIPTSLTLPGVL